jgi:hypothetical protein
MSQRLIKSVTLLELLISLSLLGLLVLGISTLNTFSSYQVISTDRQARLQNEISLVLRHMAKNIRQAIGDVSNTTVSVYANKTVAVYVDNASAGTPGLRDGFDSLIAYLWNATSYEVSWTDGSQTEVVSKKISAFNPAYTSGTNYVEVSATACWDPGQTQANCGTIDNPSVTMADRIEMPSVSIH